MDNLLSWHDKLSAAANKGILKFESKNKLTLDGILNEYDNPIIKNDEIELYINQDYEYIYIGVKTNEFNVNRDSLTIAIDITNNSGSKEYETLGLKFNREVDFIIRIDENPRILVQDRYDPTRAIDYEDIYNVNAYNDVPKTNTQRFNIIKEFNSSYYYDINNIFHEGVTSDIGILKYGSMDKKNKDYNTSSDYYIKENNIEIRIPYNLLNFSDPNNLMIHDDYYKNYGVESINIDHMFIGASKSKKINLVKYQLVKAEIKDIKEELKDSYKIIKERWNEKW